MKKYLIIAVMSIAGLTGCNGEKDTNKIVTENVAEKFSTIGDELKIIAHITLKPGSADAMKPVFEKVIAGSQAEEGCIYYDLHKDIKDTTDTKYMMIEVWKDQAAIDSHNESQHFKTFKQATSDYVESLEAVTVRISK